MHQVHSDQCYKRNEFECVQSWMTLKDVNRGDATLAFLENSHLYHEDFKRVFDKSDNKSIGVNWKKRK